MQDGTSLTNVVSHVKDNIMQTVSDLGVSVSSTSTSLEESNVKSQVSKMSHILAFTELIQS